MSALQTNSADANKDNCSYIVKSLPTNCQDSLVECFFTIIDFQLFLELQKEYSTEAFELFLPKYNVRLFAIVHIVPLEKNFSVRIEFKENKEYKYTLSKNGNHKTNCGNNFQQQLDHSFIKRNMITNPNFSEQFQNLFLINEISLEITLAIFSKGKKYFTNIQKTKFILNNSQEFLTEDICEYNQMLTENIVNPFIFRVRFTANGESPKKCDEYCGIINEGNTCYLNTIIQCFFHLTSLRVAIYKIPSTEDYPIYAIQKIFYLLQTEKNPIRLMNLFQLLQWDKAYWNSQQDAQEILSFLFDLITYYEKNCFDENEAMMSRLCEGLMKVSIRCTDIDYQSSIEEKFLFLQLDVGSKNIIDCIERYFSEEAMVGENRYEIEDKTKHEAMRSVKLEKIPQILFLHLKRVLCKDNDFIKLHDRVEYFEEIDLSAFNKENASDLIYTLYAVIVHDGNVASGHYYAFIKDFKKQRWIKFNDTKVTIASSKEVFEDNFGGKQDAIEVTADCQVISYEKENYRTAYILIYADKKNIHKLFGDIVSTDIPESLMETLRSSKRGKTQMGLREYYYPANSTSKPRVPVKSTAITSNDNQTSLFPIVFGDDHKIKVKNENRRSSINININSKSNSNSNRDDSVKDYSGKKMTNNQIISEILKNNVENSVTSPQRVQKFIRAKKDLRRCFRFQFIRNSTNASAHQVTIDKELNHQINARDFIQECIEKLMKQNLLIESCSIKMVILNNMGIFIRFIDEEEEIADLLNMFNLRELYLCFYIFEKESSLDTNSSVALHIIKEQDISFSKRDSGKLPIPPIFLQEEGMLENETKLAEYTTKRIVSLFNIKENNVIIKVIESSRYVLENIDNYKQINPVPLNQFEFLKICKSKEVTDYKVLRLVIELNEDMN